MPVRESERGGAMKKVRSDSRWARLPPEQRDAVEGWLFVEKLGYREVVERAHQEFGFVASQTSLFRYYQHRALERMQEEDAELNQTAKTIGMAELPMERWRTVALKVVGTRLVRLAAQEPENVQDLARLTRLLLDHGGYEVKARRMKLEERREQLAQDERGEEKRLEAKREAETRVMLQGMINQANEEDRKAAANEANGA